MFYTKRYFDNCMIFCDIPVVWIYFCSHISNFYSSYAVYCLLGFV